MMDEFPEEPLSPGEEAFYEALAREGEPGEGPLLSADLDLIERALDEDEKPASAPSGTRVGMVAALVAVAAALLVWVAWPSPQTAEVERGRWSTQDGGPGAGAGEGLPMAVWLVADDDEACGRIEEATLCAQRGTVVRFVVPERGSPRAEVERGRVTVASGQWVVVTPQGEQTVASGESVEVVPETLAARPEPTPEPAVVPPPEPPSPDVAPGVNDTDASQEPAEVERRRPVEDAATLLSRARAARGEGNTKAAVTAYRELLREHPRSSEANAARVSLGQLRLESGSAKAALKLFESYLRRGGSLAEEAHWGKIRALKALGRKDALGRAVDEFERKFPRSVYRSRARGLVSP